MSVRVEDKITEDMSSQTDDRDGGHRRLEWQYVSVIFQEYSGGSADSAGKCGVIR